MDIKVDDIIVYSISSNDSLLLNDYLPASTVTTEIQRRTAWVITQLLDYVWKDFRTKWLDILMADSSVTAIPATRDEFITMVITRPDYQDRAARDTASQASQ